MGVDGVPLHEQEIRLGTFDTARERQPAKTDRRFDRQPCRRERLLELRFATRPEASRWDCYRVVNDITHFPIIERRFESL